MPLLKYSKTQLHICFQLVCAHVIAKWLLKVFNPKQKCVTYITSCYFFYIQELYRGAQWLGGRVLDSRPRGRGFEPHRRHCVVSLSKNINPSLVLVQPRKTRPFITEILLIGRKESNQTNK